MTTQTPKGRTPTKPQRPDNDPVPAGWRWLRTLLTTLACLTVFAGIGLIAWSFGHDSSPYPPLAMAVLGVALFAVAQRPGLYLTLSDKFARRTGVLVTSVPVAGDVAGKAPANIPRPRRGRRKPDADQGPAVDPADSLPGDFRWLVGGARRLPAETLATLAGDYATLMVEDERYRGAVTLVREIAEDHPGYVDFGEDGFDDPGNPNLFLNELDGLAGVPLDMADGAVSSAVAAVAAAVLVHGDPDVTQQVLDVVMSPWIEAKLPFLYNAKMFKLGDDGTVHQVERPRHPAVPAQAGPPAPPVAYAPPRRQAERVDIPLADAREGAGQMSGDLFPADTPRPARSAKATPPAPPVPAPRAPRTATSGDPSVIAAASPEQFPYTVADLAMAADLVITSQFGSVPMLQRKMRMEFGTAAAIMQRLAVHLIVRPGQDGVWDVLEKPENLGEVVAFIEQNEEIR